MLNRAWLEPYDILLISEITTALASTMAGLRLLRSVIFNKTLGPLQIALGKMSRDIMIFAVFFIVLIFSFALGE